MAKLRSGELSFEDSEARQVMFLYSALEQTGNLHIVFNALEHAMLGVREWSHFAERPQAVLQGMRRAKL